MNKGKWIFLVAALLTIIGATKISCLAAEYSLYLDINFVGNLIFSTYDVDVYLDDEKIATLPHGEDYTQLIESIEEGYHTIKFCNVDAPNVSGEDIFEVKNDTTLQCTIFAYSNKVEINDMETTDGVEGAFTSATESADEVSLLPVSEETEMAETMPSDEGEPVETLPNVDYSAKDIVTLVQEALNTAGYDCGSADGVVGDRTKKAVSQYRVEKGLTEGEQIDFELVNSLGLVPQIQEVLAQQNGTITEEDARKVIIVAMTNAQATDVFNDDGNTYDPSKFHSYTDRSGDYMTLYQDGTWTQNPDQSWHVDGIILEIVGWDTYLKATADITFNGTDYVVSNVHRVIANLDYINSDDPYKTDPEDMQPSENNPFLTVPPALIQENGNDTDGNVDNTLIDNETDGSDLIILSEDWQNWYNDQFSWWDGAPTALEDLVKDALNDEKSYKFVDIETSYFVSQEQCDQANPVLEEMGTSVRLEPGDILYIMTFSAKNAFNATIKNTAYGIAKYSTDTTYLIGIE